MKSCKTVAAISVLLITALFISFVRTSNDVVGSNPMRAEQLDESDSSGAQSNKAVVKDVVYGLEVKDAALFLTSLPLNGIDREQLKTRLAFEIPEGRTVEQLSLAAPLWNLVSL